MTAGTLALEAKGAGCYLTYIDDMNEWAYRSHHEQRYSMTLWTEDQ